MRKVFIDAGGYTGDTVKLFLEKYPDSEQFEIFCFEPNPNFAQHHENKEYKFLPAAVWIADCKLDFYIAANPLGSSLMKSKGGRSKLDKKHPVKVEAVDFSKWVKDNFTKEDFIVLKLDIEGAEYQVIQKMIDDDTIFYVKELYVDWHARKLENFDKNIHENMVDFLTKHGLKPGDMCGETWEIKR
jgi:FkbM family methyltransferase